MNEAGNVTWDVVDVVAADAMRLCDEGLAIEIDPTTQLEQLHQMARQLSKTSATCWFQTALCRRSSILPRFGYRTDLVGDTPPTSVCAIFDTGSLSRQALA